MSSGARSSENGGNIEGIPPPGTVLHGKYAVGAVVGVGGMGVVVVARHVHLDQSVAIKFLRNIATEDHAAVERFLREARAAAALSTEHVAKVLDVDILDSGAPFMVMEYLVGADLRETLQRLGRMGVEDAVGAVLQACEALAEAHAMGIVHRDLKPANLFVTARNDGTPLVKVLDFGISKRADIHTALGEGTLTQTGHIIGSPAYMSPEQIRDPKNVDTRTDIWGLGVILYELLTGSPPFAAETVGGTLARIMSESPPSVSTLRLDVPRSLSDVISRCLERDLEERVGTVGELASMLAPYAPQEAATVGRIIRMSGVPPQNAAPLESRPGYGERFDTETIDTEPQWVRSGSTPMPASSSRRSILIGAAIGVAVSSSIGTYLLSGPKTIRTGAARAPVVAASTSVAAEAYAPFATQTAQPNEEAFDAGPPPRLEVGEAPNSETRWRTKPQKRTAPRPAKSPTKKAESELLVRPTFPLDSPSAGHESKEPPVATTPNPGVLLPGSGL